MVLLSPYELHTHKSPNQNVKTCFKDDLSGRAKLPSTPQAQALILLFMRLQAQQNPSCHRHTGYQICSHPRPPVPAGLFLLTGTLISVNKC